jgi:ABC-type dipeptide/oligopeptide/nickel transport system permease subunit
MREKIDSPLDDNWWMLLLPSVVATNFVASLDFSASSIEHLCEKHQK